MAPRLIDAVEEYLLQTGIAAATFGRDLGDTRLVQAMRMGRRPGARMTQRICDKIGLQGIEAERQQRRSPKWDADTAATMRQMLHNGAGREDMSAALGVAPNDVKRLFVANGMGDAYAKVMRSRRGQKTNGPHIVEPTPSANAKASAKLAQRLNAAGLVQKPAERLPLTFEQQLELVRLGKARVVPNLKVERHPTYVPSAGAMS